MHFIIGDIGNTSTRICILNDRSKILKSVIFDTKKFISKVISKIFLKNFIKRILEEKCFFHAWFQ